MRSPLTHGDQMLDTPMKLLTIGVIADELGTTPERIAYLIRTRRIRPAATAGNTRLFTAQNVARLRHELNAIDARRGEKGGGHAND